MNQQPDKLLREKLEGFHKPVPSRAWERIEANLDKKDNSALWWKVAAAILLLAIGSFALWPSNNTIPDHEQAAHPPVDSVKSFQSEPTPSPIADKDVPHLDATVKENEEPKKKIREQQEKQNVVPAPLTTEQISDKDTEVTLAHQETSTAVQGDDTSHDILTTDVIQDSETVAVQPNIITESASQNIKLVFHADDTDAYLDKKALAEATDDQENTSTFKKLLKKAKDLKNNQDPFGDLRQKKNEILALNFKNEKRGQNK